jgi:hypothetical protein
MVIPPLFSGFYSPKDAPNRKLLFLLGARHAQFENFFHVNTGIIFKGQAICATHENRSDSDGRIKSEARKKRDVERWESNRERKSISKKSTFT